MGFFTLMGMSPAMQKMSASTFAEYWQHTDHYMAARMKIFGPIMLVSIIISAILLFKASQTTAFWCTILALATLIADIIFMATTIHPLNQQIQGWDLQNLPVDVILIRGRLAGAFTIRGILMIGSFFFTLLSLFTRRH